MCSARAGGGGDVERGWETKNERRERRGERRAAAQLVVHGGELAGRGGVDELQPRDGAEVGERA